MLDSKQSDLGLFLLDLIAGNEGMPGAPLLHMELMINATNGQITGAAKVTQAIAPPNNEISISIKRGKRIFTGLGERTQIISLEGEAVMSVGGDAIGTYLAPFSAHFSMNKDYEGEGGWTLAGTDVESISVRQEV